MSIGDLVRYDPDECNNQVPGLVVGFEYDYPCVQWFDWDDGDVATENPDVLVVVSKA